MKSLISFLLSKSFWRSVLIAIVLSVLLVLGALQLINLYTHHGERIAVPDLHGMHLQKAQKMLKKMELKYLVQDSIYSKNAAAGSIIEQFPRAGKNVKQRRVIALTIAAIAPQKVVIDRVTDLSLREAIQQLSKKGITVSQLDYVNSSYTNLVLGINYEGKELNEGDTLYKGQMVSLTVGKNEETTFVVPNLLNLSTNYAKRKVLESGMNIGQLTFENTSEEIKRASRVEYQSLEAGDTIQPGTPIDLILAIPQKEEDID